LEGPALDLSGAKWCSDYECLIFYPTKIRSEPSKKKDFPIKEINVEYSNTFNDKVYDSAIFIHFLNGKKSKALELISRDTIFWGRYIYIRQK